MDIEQFLQQRYDKLRRHINERTLRVMAAADCTALGRGGISKVASASGLSRPTLYKGIKALDEPASATERIRRAGGGRKKLREKMPGLVTALEGWSSRLFSHISVNWRGRPSISHEVVIELIAGTTTTSGLKVRAKADTRKDPDKLKVSGAEMASLHLVPDAFHGEWNYALKPRIN